MTVKNPEQLAKSNKRIAIIGVFGESDAEKFVFRRSPDANSFRLSANEFFDKVRPQLRFCSGKALPIGNTVFNQTSIEPPKKDANGRFAGHGVQIPVDSPLLDVTPIANASDYEMMQARGGELFKQLLTDLDSLQQFDQSSFSSATLRLARWYMYQYASDASPDRKIAWTDWEDLGFDHDLVSKTLHYMTCCPSDEVEAESKVKSALNKHSKAAALTTELVDALVEGLRQCRRTCEVEAHDDPLIGKFISEGNGFVADFAGSEGGFHLPNVGGKSLLQYYSFFRHRSDRVHSFARNGALHSFIFMWLSGKYAKFKGLNDARGVADTMYKLSIEGQGDKRIPGQTQAERLRNFEIVRDSFSDVAKAEKQKLEKLETYERFQEALNREIVKNLQPAREFRREVLAERNQSLFIMLSQMAGGKAGAIFQQASKQCSSLVKIYRGAKNARAEEGQLLSKENFLQVFEKLRGDQNAAVMDKIIEKVNALSSSGDQLKSDVCEVVVQGIAVQTKTFFDSTFLENIEDIGEEIEQLRDIYKLHQSVTIDRSSSGAAGAAEGLGMAGAIVTNVEVGLPVEVGEEEAKGSEELQRYRSSLQGAAKNAGFGVSAAPSETQIGIPRALEKAAASAHQSGNEGEIKDASGKVLATVTAEEEGSLKIIVEDGAARDKFLSDDLVLELGGEKVKVIDADVKLDHLANTDGKSDAKKTTNNFGSLSDCKQRIRSKYMSEDESDSMFRQSARALALGEYMLAAPQSQINLGVSDLSNVLGVILDATEHIGRLDPKIFDPATQLEPDILSRMNLSLHYPVNDRRELQNIVQYHANQCKALEALIPYLSELRDIRALLNAASGSDAEVLVLNGTVSDQVENVRTPFFISDRPGIVYLTRQSQPAQTAVKGLGEAIIEEAQRKKDNPVVPVVVTPAEVSQAGVAFSVFSPSTFKMPEMVPSSQSRTSAGLPITGLPVNVYLAAAMSLLGDVFRENLGKIEGLTRKTDKAIADTLKLPLKSVHDGRYVTDLFRDLWCSKEGPLLSELITTKWLNLCLSDDTVAIADSVQKDCREVLKSAYDGSAEVAGMAFRGLETESVSDFRQLPPIHAPSGNALAATHRGVALASGDLGVKGVGGFGKLAFTAAWAKVFGGGAGGADDAEA
ncbi:MAG TPA: hypothetical protein VHM70_16545 [Polyangiaceae bacterium]|nr:hypothetical protein [Polyangiaceae bacterium]